MAPTVSNLLSKRWISCDDDFDNDCSDWDNWGRWVTLGIVVIVIVLVLYCICVSGRRRRRNGLSPMYGTRWMYGNQNGTTTNNYQYDAGYGQPQQSGYYGGQQSYGYNAPPAYGAGPQREDIQLQEPSHVYNPDGSYARPPPTTKY